MKMMKRSLGLLVMVLVLGLFAAGCGKKPEPARDSQAPGESQTQRKELPESLGEDAESNVSAEPEPTAEREILPQALKAPDGSQAGCPVTGEKINEQIWCTYNGMRIYFQNPEAQLDFEGDPEKYVKRLNDAGVKIEKIQ